MTEAQTVCERNHGGDFSHNQRALNELHLYYSERHPCALASSDPDLFVFMRTYRDYHQTCEDEILSNVTPYYKAFATDKPLPYFVARQYDILKQKGMLLCTADA